MVDLSSGVQGGTGVSASFNQGLKLPPVVLQTLKLQLNPRLLARKQRKKESMEYQMVDLSSGVQELAQTGL